MWQDNLLLFGSLYPIGSNPNDDDSGISSSRVVVQ